MEMTIKDYFEKYSCDKVTSGYHQVYDTLFLNLKNETIKLLEIGIGTISTTPLEGMTFVPSSMYGWKEKNTNYLPGASLRAFRDYFINGEIFGMDIQPDCLFTEERIKTYQIDSTNKEQCNNFVENDYFDIIIDDGAHEAHLQIKTFQNLYPKLKNGGIYIIEDIPNYEPLKNYFEENNFEHNYINGLIIIK
jgi:hypothetical protein